MKVILKKNFFSFARDESDELDCDIPMSSCPEGEFKCKGLMGGMGGPGGRCILQRFVCDDENDCHVSILN